MLRLELLGPGRVLWQGEVLSIPRKGLLLLAYLSLEGPAQRSFLAEFLWPEQADAGHSLRQLLYLVRKTPVGGVIDLEEAQLRLREPLSSDVAEILEASRTQDWTRVLALGRGSFLEGFELTGELQAWLEYQRDRFAGILRQALEQLSEALSKDGRYEEALAHCYTLIRQDELAEKPYLQAMRLLAAMGRGEEALRLFERLRSLLRQELGLEPLPEIVALAERIRKGEAFATSPHGVASGPLPTRNVLVGRASLLEALEGRLKSQAVVWILGEAGIGKTALVRHFLEGRPHVLMVARPEDASIPYASMVRWLSGRPLPEGWARGELARLLPELGEAPPWEEGSQLRLWQAIAMTLASPGCPGIWWLEDAHFADARSLEALAFAFARMWEKSPDSRLLITARHDELPPGARGLPYPVGAGLEDPLAVNPLDEEGVVDLVLALFGQPAKLFPRRLHRATGGNPLFILETLRSLLEAGELWKGEEGLWETPYDASTEDYRELPVAPSVRRTLLHRLERRSSLARRTLEVAAMAGEALSPEVLERVLALSAWEVLDGLEEALDARLLESTGQGYRFSHDTIAQVVREAMRPERIRITALRLAQALEDAGAPPGRIAGLFALAGEDNAARTHFLRAADHVRAQGAYAEADAYYLKALERMPEDDPERFETLCRRFYLTRQVGCASPAEQRSQLEAMRQASRSPLQESRVCFWQAMLSEDEGKLEAALEAAQAAYRLALPLAPAEAFYPLVYSGSYQRDLGFLTEALSTDLEALSLAQGLTPFHRVEALMALATTRMLLGQCQEALSTLDEAEGLLASSGVPDSAFWLLPERLSLVRARVLNHQERFAEALPCTEPALEKCRRGGVKRQELITRLIRLRCWLGMNRSDQAEEELEVAAQLAEHLGVFASEVWHLRAELALLQGDHKALTAAEKALTLAREVPADRTNALYSRGGAWLFLGDRGQARRDLEGALQLASRPRFRAVPTRWVEARLALTGR